MIVCKRCGTHNEDDATFCGTCGAFLEWEGERLETPSPAASAAPAGASETRLPGPAISTPPSETAPAGGGAGRPRLPGMPTPPPAAETTARVNGPEGLPPTPAGPSVPEAVLPQAPRPVHDVTPPTGGGSSSTPAPIVGGIDCWNCGLTNAGDRRFCRRCGTSLLDRPQAPPPPHLSWWRRLLHLPPKQEKPVTDPSAPGGAAGAPGGFAAPPVPGGHAGARSGRGPNVPSNLRGPDVPKGFRKPPRGAATPRATRSVAGKGIGLAVLAAIVVIAVVPSLRHRVLNQVHPTYKAVALATPTASGQVHCSDPNLANSVPHFSPDNTTLYWITGPVGAVPQHIAVTFQAPTSIARVRVSSNVASSTSPTPGAIPHPLKLAFSAPGVTPVTMTLDDPPAAVQAVGLRIDHPTTVTVSLLATDPGAVAGSCTETAFNFDHKS